MPFNSHFIPIMKNRIIQRTKALFVEAGNGEGLRKAVTTAKVKDTIVTLLVTGENADIITMSKEHPQIQVRYCLTRNMFQCRAIRDPIPDFLK